jgi:hypothetical protein
VARCALPSNPQLAFGNSQGFLSNTVGHTTRSPKTRLIRGSASYPRVPLITPIFPIAAAAAMQIGEALHQLDAHDVFRHLVAELPFEAQPQRRAVGNGQRLAVLS